MAKRTLAALLWFYAGCCIGAFLAFVLGLSPLLGPVLGTASALMIAADPRHIIWTPATS